EAGPPRLQADALPPGAQQRERQPLRRQRQSRVEVEDVEARERPRERPQLLRQVEGDRGRAARVAQAQVDVVAALERPLVEDEQRALDAELAQPGRDRAGAARDVNRRVERPQTKELSAICTARAAMARPVSASSSSSSTAVSSR